MKKKSEKGS